MRIPIRISGVEGIAAGGHAVANIPTERRYHNFKLFCTVDGSAAAATAVVSAVRLKVNAVTIRELTSAQLLHIAALNGQTLATGELPIYFSEPWRASVMGEELTALDLFGQQKCTLEVDLMTPAQSGVPNFTLKACYDYSGTIVNGQRILRIIKQFSQTYNAPSGEYDVDTLPIRGAIQRIHLFGASADITAVRVKADSAEVLDLALAENTAFLRDYKLAGTATAHSFPICFDFTQQITDGLIVQKDLNVHITSASAQQVIALIEQVVTGYV